jgi:transketolase
VTLADIGVADFPPSERVINVGIREQALIGATAGLSLAGLRPFAHTYAPFLVERPFEQIKLDLGHQDLGAVLVSIGASYDAAAEGRTHQSPGDVALLASLPGWTIHVPGHPAEVEEMMRSAAKSDDRIYIRLAADTNSHPRPFTGNLMRIRTGSAHGPTVVAVGPMLDRVLSATADLNATVLYASTVRPFDRQGLAAATRGDTVILVEPYNEGTSAAEITAGLADRPIRLLSIGVQNREHRRYGTRHHHAQAHGLDAASIRSRITSFIDVA